MAFEVVLPRLGWNMEEGILTAWRKKDGDSVRAGEILFEVESDKAVQEVEALESGVLRIPPDSPAPGTTVAVGTVIAYLIQPGEQIPDSRRTTAPASVAGASVPPPALVATAPAAAARVSPVAPPGRGRPAISPRARRTAAELGVEWTRLRGSGNSGRIVERDVRAAAAGSPAGAFRAVPGAAAAATVTLTTETDAAEMARLRTHFASRGAPVVPSPVDFAVKAVAFALQEFPDLNGRFEQSSLVRQASISIGIAVETDRGLVVPVIREAQSRTLMEVARETADLTERARSGRLQPEEQGDGTLRITDLGTLEMDAFSTMLVAPECAALGLGRIVARQVVVNAEAGAVAIRKRMTLSLTIDHRLAQGAPAARFLQRIKQCMETPYLWLAGPRERGREGVNR